MQKSIIPGRKPYFQVENYILFQLEEGRERKATS
jgi:hypothetical protein